MKSISKKKFQLMHIPTSSYLCIHNRNSNNVFSKFLKNMEEYEKLFKDLKEYGRHGKITHNTLLTYIEENPKTLIADAYYENFLFMYVNSPKGELLFEEYPLMKKRLKVFSTKKKSLLTSLLVSHSFLTYVTGDLALFSSSNYTSSNLVNAKEFIILEIDEEN